jgi:hypothetical protein
MVNFVNYEEDSSFFLCTTYLFNTKNALFYVLFPFICVMRGGGNIYIIKRKTEEDV